MAARILVVDQDVRVGDLVGKAFAHRYDVVTVEPDLTLDWLDTYDASAIVLDLEIPRTLGWELLRVIRDPQDGYPRMAVIGTSSMAPWTDFVYAQNISPDMRFLLKPFRICYLEDLLYDVIGA